MKQEIIRQAMLTGERALFASRSVRIEDSVFDDGESPLKESADIELEGCIFRWKYPLWYCDGVSVRRSAWAPTARAGVWYTKNANFEDVEIEAPKNFRRCENVGLTDVRFSDAAETLWHCKGVKMKNVFAKGDYFGMNSEDVEAEGFVLHGNYAFDGAKRVRLHNCRLMTKDAFWNAEDVTVTDSFISGEYLGWNAKNITFVNCTVESLQGLCYVDRLVMKNCKLVNTTLAFEYSDVEADICSKIDSVLNPKSGTIRARQIGELIVEPNRVDPNKTTIICKND